MAREILRNAFRNLFPKNQLDPIKTVGGDRFFRFTLSVENFKVRFLDYALIDFNTTWFV